MVLIDTSVWIQVFRRDRPLALERHVALDEIATCLPVVQEVLQGFRDEAAFRTARLSMLSLPTVDSPMDQALFEQAVDLYRVARRAGITVRSSVHCLIAASAIRHGLTVLHHDRDYAALARVSALQERGV
jgi:predicted nucleic acid-binding protein